MYRILYPKDTFGKLLEPVPSDLVSEVSKTRGAGRKPAPSDLLDFTHSVFAADNPDGYLISTHRHFSKAAKRLSRLSTCGRVGSLSYGYLEWVPGENLEDPPDDPVMPVVKFHPHHCRSIFCPTCWAKRVKQNN